MEKEKSYCLIQFNFSDDSANPEIPPIAQRLLLSNLDDIFGLTLEVVGTGRSRVNFDQAGLNLSYELEGTTRKELEEKAHRLIKKLNLIASIQTKYKVKPFTFHSLISKQELVDMNSTNNLFFGIEPKAFQKFLIKSNFEEFFLLIEAFNDLENHRIFDAFPKFVNWLDYHDYDKAPQQKFCIIRTALSHTELRNTEKVKEMYPDIEFAGKIFVRNDHNEDQLRSLIDELLEIVKQRFEQILSDY